MDENEFARSLGRLEGKMDTLLDMYKEDRERLASVEKKQWYHSGAMGIAVMFLVPKLRTMFGL